MLLFSFCTCHWILPWLLPFILGTALGWLLKPNKRETVVEEKIVYKDKIVYQDKIVYKDKPTKIAENLKVPAVTLPKKEIKRPTESKVEKPKAEVQDTQIPFVTPKAESKASELKKPTPEPIKKASVKEKVVPKAKVEDKSATKAMAASPPPAPKVEAKKNIYTVFKNDNLQIVEGSGPKMNEVLKKHGVHTWKELSSKTKEELRAILNKENPTRYRIIDPTTWPEQSRLASESKWEDLVNYQKRLDTGRTDTGDGLTDSKVEKLLIKMGVLKKWKKDDLKAIEGIGPKISGLLNTAGIKTWKALSKATIDDLKAILDKAGSRYKLADPTSWPKQAEYAAAGKWDELQEYQDILVGGK